MPIKTFDDLKDVRHKFEIADELDRRAEKKASSSMRDLLRNSKYADHSDLRKRDLIIQELLQLALSHVNKINSPRTAIKVLSRASGIAQGIQSSTGIQKNIIAAVQALKNYVKVSRKKKTKFGKYDPTLAKSHWMQKFNEAIQNSILEVQTDIQKREGTFFSSLVSNAKTDLPINLPASKKFLTVTAPVIVSLKVSPAKVNTKTKFSIIEGRLILLPEAKLVGVNAPKMKATKGVVAAVDAHVQRKHGATVYNIPVSRPAKNILWFLVLDFGVNVESAVFAESVSLSGGVDGVSTPIEAASLSDYVAKFNELRTQRQFLNLQTQRTNRIEFEKDYAPVIKDLAYEKRRLEAVLEYKSNLEKEFAGLTSMDNEVETGLAIKQYDTKAFDEFFHDFIRLQQSSSVNRNKARLEVLEQRLEARYVYFCHQEVAREATKSRAIIKGIIARLEQAKKDRREGVK